MAAMAFGGAVEAEVVTAEGWARKLLAPQTVALVGASADPGKVGGAIFANLSGGRARLYPVNPKLTDIAGQPCFPTVMAIPGAIDLAIVAVPSDAVIDVVEQCARRGVGVVVIVSGGFAETGDTGIALETRLLELARAGGLRMLGPNSIGVYVPGSHLDATFESPARWRRPGPGPIALVCQSGAIGLDAAEVAGTCGVGISGFVSLGNKCDLNENDLVRAFAQDPDTRCIALYLEDFIAGREFVWECRRILPAKPIVVAKAGRSEAGARAAGLHTGALAVSDRVVHGALKQAGIVRAYDVVEMMDCAQALSCGRPLYQPRLAVLTAAGGYGVVLADYLTSQDAGLGATLATLEPRTEARLRAATVPFAAVRNPVDLTGSATNAMLGRALEALEADPGVDAIVVSLMPYAPQLDAGAADVIQYWHLNGPKPVITVVTGSAFVGTLVPQLWRVGALAYPTPLRAMRAIRALCQRGDYLRRFGHDA